MTKTVRTRAEIPIEYTADTASVFATPQDWEHAYDKVVNQLPAVDRYRGHLAEGPQVLLEWLHTWERLYLDAAHLFVYAGFLHNVDTNDQEATARSDRAEALFARVLAVTSFSDPEILAIGSDTLQTWMRQNQELAIFAHFFDQLERRQSHVRSPEVEEVIGLAADPFLTASSIHGTLADSDLRFQPARGSTGDSIEIAQGNIDALLSDADREVRRTAWENYADAYLAYANTMASCLSGGVKQDVFHTRARRYSSSLEAALSADNIPTEVFHNLIAAFRKHLPVWHRYWAIRRQALGYDRLHPYDIWAPLSRQDRSVSYAQAVEWIVAGMAPLGDEYVETLRRGATIERWVDVYPNSGKHGGAFSAGVSGTHPFVLMSYNDDLEGMSTLAHEMGHSLHSYFTWQSQPLVYADYSTFVAEVASNFNQALVRDYLMREHADPDFQIALIQEAMSNFHRYLFVMPTLARFELEIHQRVERGEALTAENLTALMADFFAEGYGDEVQVDRDRVGITWAQFPTHLYSNFYVFQYATGIAAAHALAQGVLEGRPGAVEKYLSFLKTGSSVYPLEALKLAGVDMTQTEVVDQGFATLARMVDRLSDLLEQREAAPA